MLYLTRDGRRVLKDTNDSSADFNTECVPSLIEQQHTAIDAMVRRPKRKPMTE